MKRYPNLVPVQIRITGRSGYVSAEEEYKDVLTITDHSIEYECTPYEPWKMNPNQKWSFTTNSIAFGKLFELVADAVIEVFHRNPECPGTDMPETGFMISFSNGKSVHKSYLVGSDEFRDCFDLVKKMIPGCELMPGVLKTSEDYDDWRLYHDIVDTYCREEIDYSEAEVPYAILRNQVIRGNFYI